MSRRATALLVLLALVAVGGAKLSGAVFSASSASADNRFGAAFDWTAPSVSMADPGSPLKGSIALTASGSDALSGIASLTIQRRPAGGSSWTEVCTGSQSPLSCSLDTTTAATPDGLYDVRAVATDREANTATHMLTNRRIDNTAPASVAMDDPGALLTGTNIFSGAASDAGSGIASLTFQYRPAGTSSWTVACATSSTSCSFNTATIADGSYDLRLLATDRAGNQTASDVLGARTVDNNPPTSVTMADPGTLLSGTRTFSGTASDAGSGIASLRFQHRPAGTSSWTEACATSSTSCSFNTATIADGDYDLRLLATDNAGNQTASDVLGARKVDNAAPSVTLSNPGTMRATLTLSSTTGDGSGSGVSSVRYQYATVGGSTWTDACTATTAPFGCSFNTTTPATPDGRYDLRAIATDAAGFSTTSAVVADKRIDNTAPTSVTMTDPGTALRGTNIFSGAASDAGSGIASLTFQYRLAGASSWTVACATSSTSCSFNTATISDGSYDLRSLATDNAGNQTASNVLAARTVDNTAPTSVTMADPGTLLSGARTFSGTASDTGSGIASLKFQYRPAGTSSWTEACATSSTSCSFNTATIADGDYDLRSLATDNAGNQTGSAVLNARKVDNAAPSVTLSNPGTMRATLTLSSTAGDGSGSGVSSVRYQYATVGGSIWTDACTATTAPFGCSFNTATSATPDGRYDLRAIATDAAGFSTTSALVADRWIDNTAPASVTMADPGTLLTGTRTFSGGASDAGSGIASLTFQYKLTTASSWIDACTTSSTSCSFNTATISDGDYDLRSLATDNAGHQTASAVLGARKVDNNGPAVTLISPGTHVGGTAVVFDATANDSGSGVASVKVQYRALGGTSFTDLCTDTTAPYSCTLNTKAGCTTTCATPEGPYEFRAVAADNAGLSTASAIANVTIDNTRPTGSDVQAINGAAKPGIIETGDRLELRYSETMKPSTILAGWDGSSTTITVRFLHAQGGDRIEFFDAANTTKLNLTNSSKYVNLIGDYVPASGADFAATMVRNGATLSITLGTLRSGAVNSVAPLADTMSWSPSDVATDLAGNLCQSTLTYELILEGGSIDVEF